MWTGCDVCVVCVVRVGGLTVVMSGRSRTAIDVRIPTIPGRGTGFHRRGRQWLHEAASAVLFFWGGGDRLGSSERLSFAPKLRCRTDEDLLYKFYDLWGEGFDDDTVGTSGMILQQ